MGGDGWDEGTLGSPVSSFVKPDPKGSETEMLTEGCPTRWKSFSVLEGRGVKNRVLRLS